jgi:hypothetical protein
LLGYNRGFNKRKLGIGTHILRKKKIGKIYKWKDSDTKKFSGSTYWLSKSLKIFSPLAIDVGDFNCGYEPNDIDDNRLLEWIVLHCGQGLGRDTRLIDNYTRHQGRTGHITRWEKSHGAPLVWGPLRQTGAPQHHDFFFF